MPKAGTPKAAPKVVAKAASKDGARTASKTAVAAQAGCRPDDCLTAPPPSIWERLDDMPRTPKTALTHQQIAESAVALADAEGLAAVSMRKLAERLGVATMALYRYVANKDELLELMVDAAGPREPLPTPGTPGDWRAVFRESARRRRVLTLAHPWVVEAQALVANMLTPSIVQSADQMLAVLGSLGLDGDSQMLVLRAIDAYAKGAIEGEVNQRLLLERRGFGADGDIRLLLRSNMHWLLNSGRFPNFAGVVRAGLRPPDPAEEFETGLECLMDGLAARFGI